MKAPQASQQGATAVEFALVLLLLLMVLLGVTDFARMLFTWSAAREAAWVGARYAAVCMDTATSSTTVLSRMQGYLPQIQSTSLNVSWEPVGCTSANCERVRVTISGMQFQWLSPIPGALPLAAIDIPATSAALPRERMRQDPHSASLCS